jgi:ADP-ribose pyrophosphatase YjhB (NUDIX family)
MHQKFVRSGVSAFVLKMPERRLLLIGRENHPGRGLYCFPGGTQEYGETMMQAMIREVREETGHIIRPPQADHRPPVVCEEISKEHGCHWIIHCGLFEAIDKVPSLEQDIQWEWFATDKNDKGCRHVSELQDSEVIQAFWDVYSYFIPSVDHQ